MIIAVGGSSSDSNSSSDWLASGSRKFFTTISWVLHSIPFASKAFLVAFQSLQRGGGIKRPAYPSNAPMTLFCQIRCRLSSGRFIIKTNHIGAE
ncbi:Uncharacterised protein [Leclercia adecarboxylata]|uniref:Uncharacterized protein n=1 Tax=Leclercia adecarboxylata TaxID=83655 RepID=A0A4U9HPX2_9ENTR|nr:Uncharacterised protein [Leclercia adecarboxylata]